MAIPQCAVLVCRIPSRRAERRHRLGLEPPDRDDQRFANSGAPFRLASLTAAQQASLIAGWLPLHAATADGAGGARFSARGRSNEGIGTPNFRIRAHVLGDFVYSGAVPVGAPSQQYTERVPGIRRLQRPTSPERRRCMSEATMECCTRSTIRARPTPERKPGRTSLGRCSVGGPERHRPQPERIPDWGAGISHGGIPTFEHKFYVNATPRIWDVDFANTNTATAAADG